MNASYGSGECPRVKTSVFSFFICDSFVTCQSIFIIELEEFGGRSSATPYGTPKGCPSRFVLFCGYQAPNRQRTYRVKILRLLWSQVRVIPNSGFQCQYFFQNFLEEAELTRKWT